MREIVFDTETTGLDCLTGDRLIEIGCVELLNHIPTGRTFHAYVNPRRPVAYEASLVHGLTDDFLRGQPGFEEIVERFAEFVGDSVLIAHNAGFDRGFINMELGLCGRARACRASLRRHAGAGAPAPSELAEQPRRALRPLRDRHQRPHQARRAARREDPGRGLSRADRRPAGEPVARRRSRRPARRSRRSAWSGCARARFCLASRPRTKRRTRLFSPASAPSRCGSATALPDRRAVAN